MGKPLLVINIAGLGQASIGANTPNLSKLAAGTGGPIAVQPTVPALTSVSQATLLTGSNPAEHGIVGNSLYFRDLAEILNWQRSAKLIDGETIWDAAKQSNPELKTAYLFWRHAAHGSGDVKVMERPTYWADGRKSEDIYSEPANVRDELVAKLGPFPLFRFWGPLADITSTQWIVNATLHTMQQDRFDLVFTYLPHLDYDHQRFGPNSTEGQAALQAVDIEAGRLIDAASAQGMNVAVVSDYAFEPVDKAVYLNRVLRKAGYITVENAQNGELLEAGASRAFAICDQQVAFIHVNDQSSLSEVEQLVSETEGVEQVFNPQQLQEMGIAHSRAGELLAVSKPGHWFAYPYWLDEAKAPDFAKCVAIHAKPGFDPTELFFAAGLGGKLHMAKRLLQKMLGLRAPFDVISGDTALVRGSHGRIPTSNETRPVLITSWDVETPDVLPMQDIKQLLVDVLG